MTARVINLNRFRKRKAAEDKQRKADENAIRKGRTKAEREREAAERRQLDEKVDDHKRDRD